MRTERPHLPAPGGGLSADMNRVPGPRVYDTADDLWAVTAYFNPAGDRSRALNYEVFRRRIVDSNLHLLTVECAFGDAPFVLPASSDVLQVRSRHVMWQKERLLNLAMARLPARCAKVAWLDCDIMFANPSWAVETARLLDHHALVQPFSSVIRLPRPDVVAAAHGEAASGFAAMCTKQPELVRAGTHDRHGETGFAWAARRSVLEAGLYDASVVGGGDHLIAHSMSGDWESNCVELLAGIDTPLHRHLRRWGERFFATVRGDIACVGGAVFHLWHGDLANRDYDVRHEPPARWGFDPDADLHLNADGCWEWSRDKPELHRWVSDYFLRRDEDGAKALADE